jgi:hypothetical protein
MATKGEGSGRTPVMRSFSLPNGDKIVSLRESTFRAAVHAANGAVRTERAKSASRGDQPKPR